MTVSLYCIKGLVLESSDFFQSGSKQYQLSSEWVFLKMELIDIKKISKDVCLSTKRVEVANVCIFYLFGVNLQQ